MDYRIICKDVDDLSPIARFIHRLAVKQNNMVASISPRLSQRLRCNRITGHFHKWYLGNGSNCLWCMVCRTSKTIRYIIPYTYLDKER